MINNIEMEFINKIKYQETQLSSDLFVKCILAELRKEEPPEIDSKEEDDYYACLPLDFGNFLAECNKILKEDELDIQGCHEINVDYLLSILYTGLCREDTIAESESIPIQALILFLTLNSGSHIDALAIDKIVFKSVFDKILEVFKERIASDRTISASLMLIWNKFFDVNKNTIDIEAILEIFHHILLNNSSSIIYSFELDNQAYKLTTKAVFICLKTIVDSYPMETKRDIVAVTCLKLIKNCSNNILNQNITYFFQTVLHKFCSEEWYFPLLILILKKIEDKELYIKIINQLPPEKHENMVNIIINSHAQASDTNDIEMYLTVMKYIIELPYQDIPDDRRQKLVKRILTETYFRASNKSYSIREQLMHLFINWCQMKDINVRRHMQQLFHSGNKVSAAQLFEILQQGVDISWKLSVYNTTFITLICRLFMLNRLFITQYRLKVLETLCYRATAHCFKPCVPIIIELIRHYSVSPHPILKPMLSLIINNSLSPTDVSKYYMKEFFDLFSNCLIETSDSEIEFSICNVIMADDFKCLELFKILQIHNYIRPDHIKALLQEKILKYPSSWKLLSILLDNTEYTQFPQYMEHYFLKCKPPSFFLCPESLYMIQTMSKIFLTKVKNKSISFEDKKLANSVEECLMEHVRNMAVPAKHINEVVILILTVNKITGNDKQWLNDFFQETLEYTLKNIGYMKLPIVRHLMYLEQMLVLLDMDIDEPRKELIMNIMSIDQQKLISHEPIYAGVVTFFTKVCLKYHELISKGVQLLQYAMMNSPPTVQILTISSLYDLSNLYLHYYEALYTGLFTLIKSDNIDVKNMAVKILIKLVNDDHIRLTCNDFITLILILVDRNYRLCLYFLDIIESDFIHRNQHTISKYLIHLIFYLNKYMDHHTYNVTLTISLKGEQDFTYDRRIIIYKFLYCNLERSNQLQILNALNTDFLLPFYNGRIEPTPNIWNILRDILTLVCFYAFQYTNSNEINNNDDFFQNLFEDMKKDFFSRKRFADATVMELDKSLENLIHTLMKLLYKIEKSYINMLSSFFCTIGVATKAFYQKVVQIVHNNSKLKALYYELESCYNKHKHIIKSESIDILSYCDREEWKLYLGYAAQLT